MINIKPTIQIYNDEGKLTKAYDKAINKMIDVTMDVDLSQFDFDEVYEGKCKEFDDLVTKLCKQSGLGSDTIYALLLTRFTDEDEYLMDYDVMYTYGLDELEESKKTVRKSLKESNDIFNTLENAWDRSTMNNNAFEKTVLKLKTDSFKDPFDKHSTIYMFADGSSIDCDNLDPFDCNWCTYVSKDLSFVYEFKK